MISRQFILETIHGDTDETSRRAWWEANQDALIANDPEYVREPLVCDVTAVFKDKDAGRIEIHIKDWTEAAQLKLSAAYTLTLEA